MKNPVPLGGEAHAAMELASLTANNDIFCKAN
jgi:hypothetical protein